MSREITLENGKKVKISEESYRELQRGVEKDDFSEFVRTNGRGDICIFGDKMLKSVIFDGEVSIIYNNCFRDRYNKTPDYEVITVEDLKYGDVFIEDEISANDAETSDFKIAVGFDSDGDLSSLFIGTTCGLEQIRRGDHQKKQLVKRFLRFRSAPQ